MNSRSLPTTEADLEEFLTRPSIADVEAMSRLDGDIMVLGAGGKMGPTLVLRVKRAIQAAGVRKRVIAVVRKDRDNVFGPHRDVVDLVETDLLSSASYRSLPDAHNVVFMVGRKFGSVEDRPLTWATNAWVPGLAADRFQGSRIIAFSTGNIYPFVPVDGGGATEATTPQPTGEYAQSALGRERLFEFFASATSTPTLIYRLNYAIDLHYGVLVDIGNKVLQGKPVDVTTGHVNVIWQGDANSYCLRAFEHCSSPAMLLNVTGQRTLSVRELAHRFGKRFGKTPIVTGDEAPTALLNNPSRCVALMGAPELDEDDLFEMTAAWLGAGGAIHGKPTKFESRDGSF
jgi:hypothetical protein